MLRLTSAALKGFLRSFASWGTTQGVLWKAARPIDKQMSANTQARRILRSRRARGEIAVIGRPKKFRTNGPKQEDGTAEIESSGAPEDKPEEFGIKEKDSGGDQPGDKNGES